jgi:hypothetical protein
MKKADINGLPCGQRTELTFTLITPALFPERMEGKKAVFEGWQRVPVLFDSMDFLILDL